MIFTPTRFHGAYLLGLQKNEDERGFFARTWCQREFEERGLNSSLVQCNLSYSRSRGTLRGMHYQVTPYEEAKLVRCSWGAIYDVIVDLRTDSPTFMENLGVILNAEDQNMLFVPEGFAHGFLTLVDNTYVYYQMSEFYAPEYTRGFRWDDPAFGICWPEEVRVISEKDRNFPDFVQGK